MEKLLLNAYIEQYLRSEVVTGTGVNPYENAKIKILTLNPEDILPTAKYVLEANLLRLIETYKSGTDIFNLSGIINVGGYLMCPPIIEVWSNSPYSSRPVIVDGGHRIFLARLYRKSIKCVCVSEPIGSPLPVLPINWSDVKIEQSVPSDKRKYNPDLPDPSRPNMYYRLNLPGSEGPRS